ncbi:MULE transposase domain-containing protein, partial [Phytophthora infestans]
MPPEEELPPYPGHSKQRKTPSRFRRAIAPAASGSKPREDSVRHCAAQEDERVLGAKYGDRFPNQRKTNSPLAAPGEEFRWEAEVLKTLQADESTHSDYVASEEITDMDDLGASLDGVVNNDALAEVLDQLDGEDELASHGDSNDGDYEEDGAMEDVSSESTESIAARNRKISAEQKKAKKKDPKKTKGRRATGGTLLPDDWELYSRTYLCCTARVNARVRLRPGVKGFYLVVKETGIHNDSLTHHQWFNYAEIRRFDNPQLREDVAVMAKDGAKPRGILEYLRSKTGKRTTLKDVHNMTQTAKQVFRGGKSDAERALSVVGEFIESAPGNTAEFIVDSESNVVRVVTFQSARQKRLFAAFPEVVLVDSTHETNANRYKLFSFAVHDVFGKGQYVQHALVLTEEKPNLALAVNVFKKNNPDWPKIRVVMTDKALHEKEVLNEEAVLSFGWSWQTGTKQLKVIMKGLVNAESQQEYDDFKDALHETVGKDEENVLYEGFMKHWDTTTEEWVMFKRGGVPHLKNKTNNRLESKWGRVKEIVDGNFTIDEPVPMLITMQNYAEEWYLAKFYRLSNYAFKMVEEQNKLALGLNASYDIEVDGMRTTLTILQLRKHTTLMRGQTCLLPCRHIMFLRSKANYETVVPSMRTFSSRWIVQSPASNIETGDVSAGGPTPVNCQPIQALPAIDRDTKYSRSKQLSEKIIDVMSLQPSTTFRLAMKWLEGFHTALHTGQLEDFAGIEA